MAMGRTAAAAPLGPSRSSPAEGRSKPRRVSVHTTAPPPTDDSATAEARARVEPSCGVLAHGTVPGVRQPLAPDLRTQSHVWRVPAVSRMHMARASAVGVLRCPDG